MKDKYTPRGLRIQQELIEFEKLFGAGDSSSSRFNQLESKLSKALYEGKVDKFFPHGEIDHLRDIYERIQGKRESLTDSPETSLRNQQPSPYRRTLSPYDRDPGDLVLALIERENSGLGI